MKLLFDKESSGNIKFFIALNFDNGYYPKAFLNA